MGDSCTEIKHLAFSNLSFRFLISLQFSWALPHTATKELAACWKETNTCIALDQPFYGFLWDLLVLCPKHQKFPRTFLPQLVFNSVMRSQLSFGMDTKEGWNARTPPQLLGLLLLLLLLALQPNQKCNFFLAAFVPWNHTMMCTCREGKIIFAVKLL